ncbi:MAG TPA: O-antigen ligase family protein [bacterium]|nr:O-antigen ligase family protein [bacterium]
MLVIATILGIFWLLLAFTNLPLAVSLIAGLLPTYLLRFKVGPLPMTILEEIILLTTAVWLVKAWPLPWRNLKIKPKNWRPYPFTVEIIVVLLVAYLAVWFGGSTNEAWGIWKAYFIEPILLFIVALNVLREKKDIGRTLFFLAGSLSIVGLVAGYQYYTGQFIFNPTWANPLDRRATSIFGFPNAIGLFAAPVSLVLLGFLKARFKGAASKINWGNFLLFISILLGWLAIYWAHSEGALVGLAAALIFLGLLSNWRSFGVTLAILGTISAIWWQRPELFSRIEQKARLADLSGQIRQSQWQETWRLLEGGKNIKGAGLANYQTAVKPYHHEGIWIKSANKKAKPTWQPLEIYLYPHNIFLNFWSELGLAGLLIFLWLWIKAIAINLLNYWRFHQKNNWAWLSWGLAGAWLATLIHGLVDVPYFKNDLAVMFWLGLALTGWLSLRFKNKQNDTTN